MIDDNESNKKITFVGVNTKYQIKKVIGIQKTSPKIRAAWDEFVVCDKSTQLRIISDLSGVNVYSKEIVSKLNGYRNQDALKKRYDADTFITFCQAVELLIDCGLTCFYCKCYTPVLYKNVRDGEQWTLDRTNNDIGHSYGNVVISCLKCNLQRKRMSATAFAMSKQMVITRVDF
jgi:hypothetical protein